MPCLIRWFINGSHAMRLMFVSFNLKTFYARMLFIVSLFDN